MKTSHRLAALLVTSVPVIARAADDVARSEISIQNVGASGLWMLANISYAGMRAQNSPHSVWRVVALVVGLPGTLVTFFAVKEGSERAYGIDIPKKLP